MWRELIERCSKGCTFAAPADVATINAAEMAIGAAFPLDLKTLLLESDGVRTDHGVDLIWPVDRIRRSTIEFRENCDFAALYQPFSSLVLFAAAGNGDLFAFPALASPQLLYQHAFDFSQGTHAPSSLEVIRWNHEDDSRTHFAASLRAYLERVRR